IGDTSVKIEATLTEQGGGIGRVEWRVNGITRSVQDLARAPTKLGDKIKVASTPTFAAGTNVVEMVAYNKVNLAASLPAAISLTLNSSVQRPRPKLHVFAVGVDKYSEPAIEGLNYSIADVKSVLAAFDVSKADKKIYDDVIGYGLFGDQV